MQQYQEQFEDVMSDRQMVSAISVAVGGGLVVLLSLIGALGGVEFLLKSGYGWVSLLLWFIIAPLGYLIYLEKPLMPQIASGMITADLGINIVLAYGFHGTFPGWLIVLKFLILVGAGQVIVEEEDDDQPPPMQPPQQQFRQPPRQNPNVPQPRTRRPVGPRR